MHGFGSWFEVEFGSIPDGHDYSPVTLSTSPWKPYVRENVRERERERERMHDWF